MTKLVSKRGIKFKIYIFETGFIQETATYSKNPLSKKVALNCTHWAFY